MVDQDGLRVTRRQIDDQPPLFSAEHSHQFVGDRLHVPVVRVGGAGFEVEETPLHEPGKVGPHDRGQEGFLLSHRGPRLLAFSAAEAAE